jgi:hypothetical protein
MILSILMTPAPNFCRFPPESKDADGCTAVEPLPLVVLSPATCALPDDDEGPCDFGDEHVRHMDQVGPQI